MTSAEVVYTSSIKEEQYNSTTVCIVDCQVNPPQPSLVSGYILEAQERGRQSAHSR